jgi:hypothetical protein
MTTIYKVSKKLWIDSSKDIERKELELETNPLMTRLDNVIKECGVNPLNNPDIETIRKDERKKELDEWCKVHEEVLKDIQTSAYGEGYHHGEIVGAASEREILKQKYSKLIMAASINNENPGWVQIAEIEDILKPYDIIVPDIENLQEFPFRSNPKKEIRPSKTDWCKNTFCSDCPDSDTCSVPKAV